MLRRSARFLAVLTWLVPRPLYATADERDHARRVAAFVLAMFIWVPVFGTVFWACGADVSAAIVLTAGAGFAATLGLLRVGTSASVCGGILTGSCWYTITGVSFSCGGIAAPSVVWYSIIPVLSLWLSGTRSGLIWTATSLAAVTGFAWAREQGIAIPNELPADHHHFVTFACLFGAVCCVFLLVYVLVKMEYTTRTRLREANRRLHLLARLDGLTGMANRREFDGTLEQEWLRHQRLQLPLSLILIDVDFFKPFNDLVGHLAGDDCLKSIAQAIQAQTQRTGDLAARYGGEEFVVILANTDARGAAQVAERIRVHVKALAIPHPGSSIGPQVTVSAGTTTAIPSGDASPLDFLSDADEALYRAKSRGRDCTVHFSSAQPKILQFVG